MAIALDTEADILTWLREDDPARTAALYAEVDRVRRERVGDAVHLRGLVEIGNVCGRRCTYCGVSAAVRGVDRYRMSEADIQAAVRRAVTLGFGTVVLQGGEDYGLETTRVTDMVAWIKRETSLAVTLSLGERPYADLASWRDAGADRYLLRFETSDPALYAAIHPPLYADEPPRLDRLPELRHLGYEVGSGVMVGLPGQTFASLAHDIALFRALDLDMVGVGPYLPHPGTALGRDAGAFADVPREQVPNTDTMTFKVVALTRLVCPEANIPSTTALATANPTTGHSRALTCGANVVMPNLTPPGYRAAYAIYPEKATTDATDERSLAAFLDGLKRLGRHMGRGPGNRFR